MSARWILLFLLIGSATHGSENQSNTQTEFLLGSDPGLGGDEENIGAHLEEEPLGEDPELNNPEVEAGDAETPGAEVEAEGGDGVRRDVYVAVYALIIFLIVASNVAVIIVVLRSPALRQDPNNIFLTSLVLARSFIGSFVVPAQITGLYSALYLGSILCKLCHLVASGSAAASVFSIVAVAVVKLLTVERREAFFNPDSVRTAWGMVGLLWVFGFIYAIRAPIVYDLNVRQIGVVSFWTCSITDSYKPMSKYFILVDLVILFAIPLVIILYCYCKVIALLAAERGSNEQSTAEKKNIRNIEMIVVLVILFIICSILPMFMNLYLLWGGPYFEGIRLMEDIFYMFSYSNSWFNVFVFWHYRNDLRGTFLHMCGWRKCCQVKVVTSPGPSPGGLRSGDSEKDKDSEVNDSQRTVTSNGESSAK